MLHAAVRKKDVDIAKILVECGCPVDLQNVTKETVFVRLSILAKKYLD